MGPRGRRIFADGRLTVCVGISELYSPRLIPILAEAGADYVFIDMEHTSFSIRDVAGLIDGARGCGLPIISGRQLWTGVTWGGCWISARTASLRPRSTTERMPRLRFA